jgi:sugar/nucleoside kinase (ribokinase family)
MRTLCLGEALVDLVCERPVATLAEADAFVPHLGGAVANVAVTVARRGARAALAGGAGADSWGEWLHDRLAREGVDTDYFALLSGVRTPVAFVTVDGAAQPTFHVYGEGIETLPAALDRRLDPALDGSGALFFTSNTLVGPADRELTMRARELALERGLPVVFDPNFRSHRWANPWQAAGAARECVRGALLVKCTEEEARLLTGERDPEDAAGGLLAGGARHVVITRGARGAILRGGRMRYDVPALQVDAVDATGAGDVLTGVLLAALSETGYYPPAIAAALPDAVAEAGRATARWGAVG